MGKTSSQVKNAWNAKTYKRYTLYLRYDDDKKYIEFINGEKNNGRTIADIMRNGIDNLIQNENGK